MTRHLVAAVWSTAKLKPHLSSAFNFSNDPEVAGIGLRMNYDEIHVILGNRSTHKAKEVVE